MSYKLIISGIDSSLSIEKGMTTVLSVANKTLFSRLAVSFLEGSGEGLERFAFYNDDSELKFSKCSLAIACPLELPLKNASLLKSLFSKIEDRVKFNDEFQLKINELQLLLNQALEDSHSDFKADYDFDVEFDVKKYLKAFGYSIECDQDGSLIDNLISFLKFIADVAPDKVLLFINLRSFLEINDYIRFCNVVFSLKLTIFIIDSSDEKIEIEKCTNYMIDQHFILY